MKKLLLLPLFLLLIATACQEKETEAEPLASRMIQGKWTRSHSAFKYYDASNNLVYDDSFEEEVFFDFGTNRFSISHPGSEDIFTASYSVQKNDNVNIIRLVDEVNGITAEYEITTLTETETDMVWREEVENANYDDGSGVKLAARAVRTYTFTRTE